MFLTPACIGGSCAVNSSFLLNKSQALTMQGLSFYEHRVKNFHFYSSVSKLIFISLKGEIHCLTHILSRCLLPAKSPSTSLTFRI